MSVEDMHALSSAFSEGKLAEMHVVEVRLMPEGSTGFDDLTDEIRALALKQQQKRVSRLADDDFTPPK
jgi:hypothetical protein